MDQGLTLLVSSVSPVSGGSKGGFKSRMNGGDKVTGVTVLRDIILIDQLQLQLSGGTEKSRIVPDCAGSCRIVSV